MRAHTFLSADSTSYLTGLRWPTPTEGSAAWIERDDDAIRACLQRELVWWLDDELWEVELDGDVREVGRALTASRARLLARVGEWTADVAWELVAVCARRVRNHAVESLRAAGCDEDAAELEAAETPQAIEAIGAELASRGHDSSAVAGLAADVVLYARDAREGPRAAAVAAYIAAYALAGGDKAAPAYQERFDAERAWQATWLSERLQL